MDLYLYPSRITPISPETVQLADELLGEWCADSNVKLGFTVDIQSDRVRVLRGGDLDSATVVREVRDWTGRLSASGRLSFYANEWPDLFELRRRVDFPIEQGGYRADPDSSGDLYAVTGANDVEVGILHISRDGWVGVSSSMDTSGKVTRTVSRETPRAALGSLLRALGLGAV